MRDIILKYFSDAFSYLKIVELLNHFHDFQISLSTLKRWLKDSNLKRRPLAAVRSSNEEIRQAVQEELNDSVSRVGYRRVYRILVRKGLFVRKHFRLLIKELDLGGYSKKRKTFMQTQIQ